MNLIIDSIMGSGKTTWAIRCMNNSPGRRFIFATPFLDEDRRIREGWRKKETHYQIRQCVKS